MENKRFSPSICVTHDCNLNCIYCYQKHSVGEKMPFNVATNVIDWIFLNVPQSMNEIEITLIGGEPLLEYELIKEIIEYTYKKKSNYKYIFYASTNGTILNDEMKTWFSEHKQYCCLGLSLDGTKDVHNYNRSNSFEKIDIDFFKKTWPYQSVKMTLSEYSLKYLAESIKYIHSLGFIIKGVNQFEGNFDWNKDEYIKELCKQLKELVEYYLNNDTLVLDQMFDKNLFLCEAKIKERKKWCGIGYEAPFFDIDGKKYPCNFITPMTFSDDEINKVIHYDYENMNNFIDEDCFNNCYIYPICPTCAGSNYMINKDFKKRIRTKCRMQKIISLFIADLQARRIMKNRSKYSTSTLYYTIEAIKKIRNLYLDEFKEYLQ